MATPVPDEVLAAMVAMCFATMPEYYRSERLRGVVTWQIEGAAGGRWQTMLADGICTVVPEGAAASDLTVSMTPVDFVSLCLGVRGGPSLFLAGRMRAQGSRILLARLARAFATPAWTQPGTGR